MATATTEVDVLEDKRNSLDYTIDGVLGSLRIGRIGLDIGCGFGMFATRIRERGVTMVTTSKNFDGCTPWLHARAPSTACSVAGSPTPCWSVYQVLRRGDMFRLTPSRTTTARFM
jgi:hypothetical protein